MSRVASLFNFQVLSLFYKKLKNREATVYFTTKLLTFQQISKALIKMFYYFKALIRNLFARNCSGVCVLIFAPAFLLIAVCNTRRGVFFGFRIANEFFTVESQRMGKF